MRKYILSIGEKKSIFSHVLYCVHSHICNHRFSNLKDVSLVMRVPRNSSFHSSVKNFESTCVKDRLNYVRCTDMDIFTKVCLKVGFINDENLLVASFFSVGWRRVGFPLQGFRIFSILYGVITSTVFLKMWERMCIAYRCNLIS